MRSRACSRSVRSSPPFCTPPRRGWVWFYQQRPSCRGQLPNFAEWPQVRSLECTRAPFRLISDRHFSFLDVEKCDGKGPEDTESVLLFLKETVPREARNAQQALARFDEALLIMGLEGHMIKTGRRVALSGPDSAAIAEEWIKVARQYRSMLPPDDENPVG